MADMFGGLVSYGLNRAGQERSFVMQKELQSDAQKYNTLMYNLNNQYNSAAQQMARFKDAGLNPNLIYGQMQNGMAAPTIGAGSAPGSAGAPAMSALETAQLSLLNSQRRNVDADTDAKLADAAFKSGQTENLTFEQWYKRQMLDLETKFKQKGMELMDEQKAEIKTSVDKLLAEIEGIGVDNAVKRLDYLFSQESYDTRLSIVEEQLRNLEADTGNKKASASYYRAQAKQILDTLQPMINKLNAECSEILSRSDLNRQQKENLITQKMVTLADNAYLLAAQEPLQPGEGTFEHNFKRTLNMFNYMFTHLLHFSGK